MPSLQRTIRAGYYAFAGTLATLALLAYSDLVYLEDSLAPDVAASRLLDTALEIRRYEKNYFLYGDDDALAEVRAFAAQARGLIDAARESLASRHAALRLDRLAEDLRAHQRALEDYHHAARTATPGAPVLAAALRQAGRRLTEGAEAIAHAEHARLRTALAQSRAALLGTGAVAILLAILAAQWLVRRTTRPLGRLVSQLADIARGRYALVTPVGDDREILAVTTAVNRMLGELEARRRHLVQAEKLSSLGTLVSGVAHELNNPLSNVSTSAQLLAEELDTAPREALREWIAQIDAETERARHIVRALLDFSREGAFHARCVPLGPLLERTLLIAARLARDVDVSVRVREGLVVTADPQRLQQVMVNLVRNAVDAGGPGVRVQIIAREIPAGDFVLPASAVCGRSGAPLDPAERLVLIEVVDDGPGIAAEILPRVFDPFFTTKDVGHGLGLGLYVSQEIVHQHGGCIGVTSQPGEGTRFLIALPQGTQDPAP